MIGNNTQLHSIIEIYYALNHEGKNRAIGRLSYWKENLRMLADLISIQQKLQEFQKSGQYATKFFLQYFALLTTGIITLIHSSTLSSGIHP